jgi:hypothetical protein
LSGYPAFTLASCMAPEIAFFFSVVSARFHRHGEQWHESLPVI